jgi:hypothetical protein
VLYFATRFAGMNAVAVTLFARSYLPRAPTSGRSKITHAFFAPASMALSMISRAAFALVR